MRDVRVLASSFADRNDDAVDRQDSQKMVDKGGTFNGQGMGTRRVSLNDMDV